MSLTLRFIILTLAAGLISTLLVVNGYAIRVQKGTEMNSNDICPPEILTKIKSIDFSTDEGSSLSSWIYDTLRIKHPKNTECIMFSIGLIADRLDHKTHAAVVRDFGGHVGTYARFLKPETLSKIKAAYLRLPYYVDEAKFYFIGLRLGSIDIREKLRKEIKEDWSFTTHQAPTWHYYLYLASLNEPNALDKISKKVAEIKNGNETSHFLRDLIESKIKGVRKILTQYLEDERHTDGPNGPGAKISEIVKIHLQFLEEKE